ncbi:hypothetical protein PtrSN002B_007784 [Pyrenophora tritici-repentis]|uniref:Uncharacterized protein n=1 Tax=Pyrenophora tritici-repentis TaxID=45151 RepID=A0A2W1HD42_9PLEO|nr:hypothetical protein PtrM4_019920 [Pyrenophora tritici-repentis]KAG9388383.1 hypothetical protein A1F94_001275 [Pyrenophora tritici-repentis]KAI0574965.1 hypothetical protein Alg215_08294 [Pyrenophora tritici-repentis]KAI1531575.1 hypothetical protein PtrSN001A_007658 [Pyrenophora tritici-repentis]KAI1533591.1 hypothetical protein PtrSN001C_007541 [Pyrenophora tritici-repentis]
MLVELTLSDMCLEWLISGRQRQGRSASHIIGTGHPVNDPGIDADNEHVGVRQLRRSADPSDVWDLVAQITEVS